MIENSIPFPYIKRIFNECSFCESAKISLITMSNFVVRSAENITSTCIKIVKFIIAYIPFINKIEINNKKIRYDSNKFSPTSKQPKPLDPIEQSKPHLFLANAKYILPPVLGAALLLFILYRRTESVAEISVPTPIQPEKILKSIADTPPPLEEIPCLPVQGKALILSPYQIISSPPAKKITDQLTPSPNLEKIIKCISEIGETKFLDEAKGIFNCANSSINWDTQEALGPIKSTFRNYAKLFHPDKEGDPNTFSIFNTAYQFLKQAYSVEKEQQENLIAECITRVTNSNLIRNFFGDYYIYKCLGIPFKLSGWNVDIRVNCEDLENSISKAIKLFSIKREEVIRQIPLCFGRRFVFH